MERLFTYGSLQPGGPNEHVLDSVEGTWEPAFLRGRLVKAGWGEALGYPGLVIDESGDKVNGHLFSSSHLGDRWAYLDEFEGSEYQRTLSSVSLMNGAQVEAYVYLLRAGLGTT